ncbi:MAG: IS630 family transposase [Promethearchaeota archaeon]
MWCVPKLDGLYINRMNDVLDLYAQPYDEKEPVVCVDEKSLQLLDNLRPPIPLKPGFGIRMDYHYKRKGTRNIFVGVEPKGKKRVLKVSTRKPKRDYANYVLELLTNHYPKAEKVHLVADNLNSHPLKCHKEMLGKKHPIFKRLVFHFTPFHASWLNQAELEIGALEAQWLNGSRFPDEETLRDEVQAWADERNKQKIGINWKFTIKQAEVKFKIKNKPN